MQYIPGLGLDKVLEEVRRLKGLAPQPAATTRRRRGRGAIDVSATAVARPLRARAARSVFPAADPARRRFSVAAVHAGGRDRLRCPLRPGRRPDRPPGGRGAGVRAPAGDAPPRRQAVEHPARPPRRRLGDRLRAGEGGRGRGPDPHRRPGGHDPLHGPRAVPGPGRRPVRRLRPGAGALRAAGAAAGVRRLRTANACSTR